MQVSTWVNILATKDCQGAIAGFWVMQFEAGKTYRVDLPLAEKLMALDSAALTGAADWVMHVTESRTDMQGQVPATWGVPMD